MPLIHMLFLNYFNFLNISRYSKDTLHEVAAIPECNDKLKRITRRRKQLVAERVRVVNRMQTAYSRLLLRSIPLKLGE